MVPSAALSTEKAHKWRRLVGLAPALLVIAVAIWEIAAIARAGSDVPEAGDWGRASEALREEHRAGDLILFAPHWIDPVGRLHLGDLIPVEMAARMDGARYGRIWELSIRGAHAPETRGLTAVASRRFGALTMRRYQREAAVVLTDFVAFFDAARKRGSASVELEEVGFEPHRCIRTRPQAPSPNRPEPPPVTVTFPRVALGSELVGYVGLADVFTRRDHREPARLEVLVNGDKLAERTVGVNDGWVRFRAETSPSDAAEVEFRVTAFGRNRLVCFAAEARQ